MNEHISSSLPTYVSAHGMTGEPFGDAVDDALFYAEPTRKQKLDILLHLTQYGNELMLAIGPHGSGKTTLLQQFQRHSLDTWKVAHIEAKNGLDERKLIQQLFHQMGLAFHGATHTELLENLEQHFDSLQHSTRQAVMLIDDADQLPVTALKRVLKMAALTSADNKPLLRIILFGSDNLETNFSDPLLGHHANILRRSVKLPAFDSKHTTHYILHRLSAVQFSDNTLFTESVLRKIYKQSHGWPREINRLAHNRLIETLPTLTFGATGKALTTFKLPRAVAASVGITVMGALLFFQDEFNTWLDSGPESQTTASLAPSVVHSSDNIVTIPLALSAAPETPTPSATATSSEATPATHPQTMMISTPTTSIEDPVLALAMAHKPPQAETEKETTAPTTVTSVAPAPESPPPALPLPILAPAITTDPSNEPIINPTIVSNVETAPNTATPVNTTAENPRSPDAPTTPPVTQANIVADNIPIDLPGKREDWILQQNPDHYTLQLVAGNNIDTVRNFIQRHSPNTPFAVYRGTRKNKPWYGLVYNSFSSKQRAFSAIKQLPKRIQRQKPWVRKLSDLQNDLRKKTAAP